MCCLALLSLAGRHCIISFLYDEKKRNFFYNDLCVQGVTTYFYGNSLE